MKELGIKAGIGLQLAGDLSKWGRERSVSQPHRRGVPPRSEQEQSLVSPHTDVRLGRFGPSKGKIIPSFERDDREDIRADSEPDGEMVLARIKADNRDPQPKSCPVARCHLCQAGMAHLIQC